MFLPVLVELEQTGAPFDTTGLDSLRDQLLRERDSARDRVFEISGYSFNLNSVPSKRRLLFEELGLPVLKRSPGGEPSTDKKVLAEIDHPVVEAILGYNQARDLLKFVDKLEKVNGHFVPGRILTAYNNTTVETGRLSAGSKKLGEWSVNLQQIPVRTPTGKAIRSHFVASPGRVLYAVDASQFQLRIAAVDSGDPGMIAAFKSGIDYHDATAIDFLGETNSAYRRVAKTLNFGILFGAQRPRVDREIASTVGLDAIQHNPRLREAYDRFFESRPKLRKRIEAVRQFVREHGYGEDYFGRRNLYDIRGSRAAAEKVLREAYNFYVQGPEASIVKLFLVMLWRGIRRYKIVADIILAVHDEGVFDVLKEHAGTFENLVQEVEDELNDLLQWPVKVVLDVGHGGNWADAH